MLFCLRNSSLLQHELHISKGRLHVCHGNRLERIIAGFLWEYLQIIHFRYGFSIQLRSHGLKAEIYPRSTKIAYNIDMETYIYIYINHNIYIHDMHGFLGNDLQGCTFHMFVYFCYSMCILHIPQKHHRANITRSGRAVTELLLALHCMLSKGYDSISSMENV